MEVIPALDLRGGRVVRLGEHGDFGRQDDHGDPVARALAYAAAGARRLHVVDLDAAAGSGDNRAAVRAIVEGSGVAVQVAGGVRSLDDAVAWLDGGADRVLFGTAAVRDPALPVAAALTRPDRIGVALDLRGGRPAVRGWTETDDADVGELLAAWSDAPLAAIVLTSVDRDGSLAGPDLEALTRVRGLTPHPVIYSGGVSSLDDLRALQAAGAAGAILGRALLEGRFTLAEAVAACA